MPGRHAHTSCVSSHTHIHTHRAPVSLLSTSTRSRCHAAPTPLLSWPMRILRRGSTSLALICVHMTRNEVSSSKIHLDISRLDSKG